MKNKKIYQIVVISITFVTSILACIVLPDQIAVQWNLGGVSNYMSKYLAAILSLVDCIAMIMAWNGNIRKDKGYPDIFWRILSCIGIMMNLLFIILN